MLEASLKTTRSLADTLTRQFLHCLLTPGKTGVMSTRKNAYRGFEYLRSKTQFVVYGFVRVVGKGRNLTRLSRFDSGHYIAFGDTCRWVDLT